MYLERKLNCAIKNSLVNNPVTVIIGARQVGKTTLAKELLSNINDSLYLDLEKPSDRVKLTDAEQFLKVNNNKTICLDEIQLLPDIFPVIRTIIDDKNFNIKFLITGSASPDLLRQSSQTLAGRIAYFELSSFLFNEASGISNIESYWLRGGFPLSLFAKTDESSFEWRKNFILTFLERDLRNFGFNIPPQTLGRLWKMVAHINGQIINYSQLSNSLGVSDTTVKNYLDVLSGTFMLRTLQPYHFNIKKRLIKSPKLYFRDTGILNTLLNIIDFNELFSHPTYGSSWELLCLENILGSLSNWESFFYRTSNGNEIDLLLAKGNKRIAIEFKTSISPSVSKGFWNSLEDLNIDNAFIIAPVTQSYPYKNGVWVYPIEEFLLKCENSDFL
ncbi:MAG: ATP-binding protein [Bacteroidales bacterium]|nr:ATP-binding protein [Bacteroidales bacterium]